MQPQRNTIQRQIVLETLLMLNAHPTIDEIYAIIRKDHPSISKTTVYRNLRLLSENGVVHQVFLPDGLVRYESRIERHYHFRCKNCGKIFDIDIEHPIDINGAVQKQSGFQIDGHDVVFNGICTNCGNSMKTKK
jgi:Fur family peroxide stress response transcriptional regulator